MKAIVIREPGSPEEALRMETVPDPRPKAGDVLVHVAACGVCSHDVAKRNGTLKAGIRMPLIPGHEVSGTVVEVGEGVSRFRVGDRVATAQRSHICGQCGHCRNGREPLCDEAVFMGDVGLNGGYAELVAVGQENVALVPEAVDLNQASIVACAIGTMYHAICEISRVQPGERALVTGATGGLGMHGVQLARLAGAIVFAQTSSSERVEDLRRHGADHVIVADRGVDFSSEVREATGGAGVDVAVDTVGTPVFNPVRRCLAKAARWVMVGQVTGDFVPFNPAQLFLKGISMLSATSTTRQELATCLNLVARRRIEPVIDRTMPLAEAPAAHHLVESGRANGRVVLTP